MVSYIHIHTHASSNKTSASSENPEWIGAMAIDRWLT